MASDGVEQPVKGKSKQKGKAKCKAGGDANATGNNLLAETGDAPAKGKTKAPCLVVSPGNAKGGELAASGKGKGKTTQQPRAPSKGKGEEPSSAAKKVPAKGKTKTGGQPAFPAKGKTKTNQAASPESTLTGPSGKGKAKTAEQPTFPSKGKTKTNQATTSPAVAKGTAVVAKGRIATGKGKNKSKSPVSPTACAAAAAGSLASPAATTKLESADTLVDPDLIPQPIMSNDVKGKGNGASKGKGLKGSPVKGQVADPPQTPPAKCVREAKPGMVSPSSTTAGSPASLPKTPPVEGTRKGKCKAIKGKGKAKASEVEGSKGGSKSQKSTSNKTVAATTRVTPSDKGKGHGNIQGVKRGPTSESLDGTEHESVRRRCSFGSSSSGAFMCYCHYTYTISVFTEGCEFSNFSLPHLTCRRPRLLVVNSRVAWE